MRKTVLIATAAFAAMLVAALVGCASGAASSSASGSAGDSGADASTAASSESASEAVAESQEASSESASSEAPVGIPNPWSDVDSAKAAAEGAGIGSFELPEGAEIDLGKVEFTKFRCMDGLAEAIDEFPAVEMTVRKGEASLANDGDISGDYNSYGKTWTQDIGGIQVTCFGNREGESTKTIWTSGDYCYSVTAYGLGGDDSFGLRSDALEAVVSGTK